MPNVYFLTTVENDSILPGGANAQYYLDLMKNEITSCLNSNGISYFGENSAPQDSVGINLVIDSVSGENPGIKISYQNGNPDSNRLSTIIFENMKTIYFDPSNVRLSTEQTTTNKNLMTTITFENLQNPENLLWIRQNLELLSKEIIMSLTEFFGLPYVACEEAKSAMAIKDESIRNRPSLNAEVIGSTQANTKIDVLGQWENWYVVGKNGDLGYIQTQFIEI